MSMFSLFNRSSSAPEQKPQTKLPHKCDWSTGSKSIPFSYLLLDDHDVGPMCVWKNYVITGTQDHTVSAYAHPRNMSYEGSITIWTEDGVMLDTKRISGGVTGLAAWGEKFVSVSSSEVLFWSFNQKSKKLKSSVPVHPFGKVRCATVSREALWTIRLVQKDYRLSVWTGLMNSRPVTESPPIDNFFQMLFMKELLWTRNLEQIIGWDLSNQVASMRIKFQIRLTGLTHMCLWGDSRLAVACSDFKIRVWDENGMYCFAVVCEQLPVVVGQWFDKLVCATEAAMMPTKVIFWNPDGTEYLQISMASCSRTRELLFHKNRLWYASDGKLRLYLDPSESLWKITRLLWIAWKKNEASQCHLAGLPKELIALLVSYL